MQQWIKNYMVVKQYVFTSVNQHGSRYKQDGFKRVSVARLACKTSDADNICNLVLLSHTLDVPVRYDWNNHMAYIEVIGAEALKECI